MSTIWIDFKDLRAKLSFAAVLKHYNVSVPDGKNQYTGFCPIPSHQGKRNSPSFSANLEKGVFQCFGCQAKGNALDFAAYMSGVDPKNHSALRGVALELVRVFGIATGVQSKAPVAEKPVLPAVATTSNLPLDFELKGLDAEHPYLHSRGFTPETIQHFGLGFCGRGYLKGRVAIPLHNEGGELVGYAGRVIDDDLIGPDCPKYKFPSKREREGAIREFRKLDLLYNAHRLTMPVRDLILVEGFPSVWWLHQHGFPHSVALMGSVLGKQHIKILTDLVPSDGCILIMTDGDDPGKRSAEECLRVLAKLRAVRWVALPDGKQPTDLTGDELVACLGGRP